VGDAKDLPLASELVLPAAVLVLSVGSHVNQKMQNIRTRLSLAIAIVFMT
jgi:hypothetical protein